MGFSPNRPNWCMITTLIQWTSATDAPKAHSSFQSFLKMCHTIFPLRLGRGIPRGASQGDKDRAQCHGLRIYRSNPVDSRPDLLAEVLFGVMRIDESQNVPEGAHLYPTL